LDSIQLAKNREYVDELWVVERYKKLKLVRIRDELLVRNPYFLGWTYDINEMRRYLSGHAFDVIWVSPFLACDVIDPLFEVLRPRPIYVAGINDCTTAVFRGEMKLLVMKYLGLKTRILYILHWLRSWPISRIEAKVLRKYDLILAQTGVERTWLNTISKGELDTKTIILSNGVNEALFKNPITANDKDILFLGKLTGIYSDVASWFIDEVWGMIKTYQPRTRFFIVGKGASATLRQKIVQDKRIIYKEYIPNIQDIFKGKGVSIAPTFKNYGTINKVIESMAAGVPVVGDSGSFNGIQGFQNNRHGVVANDAKAIANSVIKLLDSPRQYISIAYSARQLVQKQFSWEDRAIAIRKKLAVLLSEKDSVAGV